MALAPHHHHALTSGIRDVLLDALRDVSWCAEKFFIAIHSLTRFLLMGRAGDAQKIVLAVEFAALTVIASVADHWNLQSTVPWLPPEVLTNCFRHLPFQDLVIASHVSRYWRSAALGAPDLWNRVQLKPFDTVAYALHELLGRSRARPVDFTLHTNSAGGQGIPKIEHAIGAHMPHMRSISCNLPGSAAAFLQHAPMLEVLKLAPNCGTTVAELSPAFLGGHAPRLRDLRLENFALPASCSALSSVTRFTGVLARWSASNVDRLFDLCPRLEYLRLENIQNSTQLPSGRVPSTLTNVELIACEGWTVDFSRHLSAWSDSSIANIRLQGCASTLDLSTYLTGVELRNFDICSVFGRRFIIDAGGADGATRHVDVSFAFSSMREVAFPILPPVLPLFSRLESLALPSNMFKKALEQDPRWRLPELKTLRLSIFHPLGFSLGGLEVPKLDALEVTLEKHAVLDCAQLRHCVNENLFGAQLRTLRLTGATNIDVDAIRVELAGVAREIVMV